MTHLRPINLCNAQFNIASKVLANRLKVILPNIISPYQSAFILERNISDNIILVAEVSNHIFKRRWANNVLMSLKLDICKAYDRIDWGYLRGILMKLGFSHKWVEMMMVCVSSLLYSFIINGCQMSYLHPSRGFHQVDHLSPYLFLLCEEGHSTQIAKLEVDGLIKGVPICSGAPPLVTSYLLIMPGSFVRPMHLSVSMLRTPSVLMK